jgi:hypothetical protein
MIEVTKEKDYYYITAHAVTLRFSKDEFAHLYKEMMKIMEKGE